jgi:hypothetical protein
MKSPPLQVRTPGAGARVWVLRAQGGTAQPQTGLGLPLLETVVGAMQELVRAPVMGFGAEPAQGRLSRWGLAW